MQYVVHAYDFADALDRRLAARERHLDGVRAMKAAGTFHQGGALLDAGGRMIGSMMLIEMADDVAVQDWLREEVYVTEGVWEKVDIKPFRAAPV